MARFLVRLYDRSVGCVYTSLYNDLDGVKVLQHGNDLDGVKVLQPADDTIPDSPPSHRIINRRYLLPCLLYSLYLLDALHLLLCSHSQWSFSGNATSDGTFARKLLPASLSQQADVFFLEITFMLLAGAVHFLLHNMESFERKYRMFGHLADDGSLVEMTQKGLVLANLEAKGIFKVHEKCEKLSHLLTSLIILFVIPFYNLNVVLNWTSSAADVKACLWITLTFPYMTMNVYTAITCFIFNCRYLRVRQRFQMDRLESLIARSKRVIGLKRARKVPCTLGLFTWSSWSLFSVINRHLNNVNQQITGYSRFWSRYLSVYFTGLTFIISYMAFIILKLNATTNMFTGTFLAYFASLLLGLLLGITLECSVLVVNNKETLKLQRIFKVHTSRIGKIPLFSAIKFDHIEADSSSIDRIGFKLLDSVQINSKMFEMLLFYISSIFMKIVEHKL